MGMKQKKVLDLEGKWNRGWRAETIVIAASGMRILGSSGCDGTLSARPTLFERAIAQRGFVRPSVCLSVTLVSHAIRGQRIEMHFALHDRAIFLVS